MTPNRNPSPNPTSAVNPSAESITALAGWPDDNAIAMVNLLKYDGAAGRQAYGRYAHVAAQTIDARGGSLIYLGPVVAPPGSWDSLAIVRYPRRAAFLDMQNASVDSGGSTRRAFEPVGSSADPCSRRRSTRCRVRSVRTSNRCFT